MTRQAVGLGRVAKPAGPPIPLHASGAQTLARPVPRLGTDTPCQDPRFDPEWWFITPPGEAAKPVARGVAARSVSLGQSNLAKLNHAKHLCRTACPKLIECLAWAIAVREPEGVWGGMDPQERRRVWARGGGS